MLTNALWTLLLLFIYCLCLLIFSQEYLLVKIGDVLFTKLTVLCTEYRLQVFNALMCLNAVVT